MTQKEGKKPIKKTVFARIAECEKQNSQVSSSNERIKKKRNQFARLGDDTNENASSKWSKGSKPIHECDDEDSDQYSCFGDQVWSFMDNSISYRKMHNIDKYRN